ncbi:MAG TPA: nitrate- and nitrite sensing domain-containing protein [Pseudonocardiaceae bacterium]|jgi:signal transduction histidine kinase|nr:nitrate- and nitrite sensing domain-containing protein [Pseudonocardiaceae bacterium]
MLWPKSIRAKLVRILVVSLALVLVLLGFLIANETSNYQAANQTSQVVTVALRVQDAVQQLQKERALTNGLLGGGNQFQAQLVPQRQQTDAALGALNQTLNGSGYSAVGADQVRTALAKLSGLTTIRSDVDQDKAQDAPTFTFYTDAITALNALDLGLDQAQDGSLRHGLQALYALGDVKEFAGQEQGLLSAVFAQNRMSVDNYSKFVEVLGQKQAAIARYDQFATPQERADLDAALQSPAGDQSVQDEGVAINGVGNGDGGLPSRVDPVNWSDSMNTVLESLRGVQQSVGSDITSRADSLRSTALTLLIGISVLAVLTIAAMIALVIGAARSVIGPLGSLARDANTVASKRLPETVALMQTTETEVPPPPPVTVPGNAASEIKLVATALDQVQSTALTLASEQALIRRNTTASLANLGRRNQNLVRRQLSLISEFEREELDPGALANMFELDHLATRMRRNAESLLVLVGETSPRPWSAPLPVADVIRAALSEVEDYRRVVLRRVDEGWVAGSVVAEVAHMLAELVENGLSFSSPDLEVEIYGRKTGNRYLLAVVDYGIGMPRDELEKAKARLRDEENFLVAPTRFLGHYVVGRLAGQLNIQVELGESPVTGITARMLLPAELVTDRPDATADTGAGTRATAEPERQPRPPVRSGHDTGPQPVIPATVTATAATATASVTRQQPVAAGSSAAATQRIAPVSKPPATTTVVPQPQPVAMSHSTATPPHRWPTEQELASHPDAPMKTVSVATLASTAPYNPARTDIGQTNGSAARSAPPAGPGSGSTPERTRNGLVKRQPRHRGTDAGRPPAAPTPSHHTSDAPAKDRSPSEVSSMLSAFRSGHQRGEMTMSGRSPISDEPAQSHVVREEEPGDH